MGAESPDIDAANGGIEPELSVWRTLLVILVSAVPLALMARGLYLALDLPKDSDLVRPALLIVFLVAIFARPMTFRHMTIATAVGITVGDFGMLCFLPVALYSQSLEIWSRGFMLRLLAIMLIAVTGAWISWLACRRLAVPVLEMPAKDQS